jgi:hypothetical protein
MLDAVARLAMSPALPGSFPTGHRTDGGCASDAPG